MSGNFRFDTRPEVEPIVYRHKAACTYTKKEQDGRCRCPKHIYVRLTRARISAQTKSWETARQRAKEWADTHDPMILRERAREADNAIRPKLVEEAFTEFIAAKGAAFQPGRLCAQDGTTGCSLSTVKGIYSVQGQGTVIAQLQLPRSSVSVC
jgi:hypothetical protein